MENIDFLPKDNHRGKVPSNKTQTLTKSMNMDIWVVGALNLVFIRGLSNEIKFSKNKGVHGKTLFFWQGQFCTPHSICLLILVFDKAFLYENATFSIIILSSKKLYSSFLKKTFSFPENLFQS